MGHSASGIHSASILCNPGRQTITFDLATRFRELSHVVPLWMEYQQPEENESRSLLFDPLEVSRVGTLGFESTSEPQMTTRIGWTPPARDQLAISRPGAGLTIQWGYRIRLNPGKP